MGQVSEKDKKDELLKVKEKVNDWALLVLAIFLLSICIYGGWFGFYLDKSISNQSADWGTFGDFMGGFMNPIISFFTLLIVARAYISQKEELGFTVSALEKSSKAQDEQTKELKQQNILTEVQHSLTQKQQRIDIATAILNGHLAQLAIHNDECDILMNDSIRLLRGSKKKKKYDFSPQEMDDEYIDKEERELRIRDCRQKINETSTEIERWRKDLETLFEKTRT